jgi:uncharacterized protein
MKRDQKILADTSATQRHADALCDGRLIYQDCTCGNRWLPPKDECPVCLGTDWNWKDACGRGRLISWVVYRVAYDERFQDKLPYNVAIVELEEGPRLISNIVDFPDGKGLLLDMPLELTVQIEDKIAFARFKAAAISGPD